MNVRLFKSPAFAPGKKSRSAVGSGKRNWLYLIAMVVVLCWSYGDAGISPSHLFEGLGNAWRYVAGSADRPQSGFFPPSTARIGDYLAQMVVTIKMAIWGTTLSIPFALLLAFCGARNVVGSGVVYWVSRRVLDLLRSLNELVIALIFVAAVGLGPFSGVMALAVGGIGSLGKLLSEAVEAIDMGQVEAVKSTGANPLPIIMKAFVPQILPAFVSFVLYRFEANVRAATILGVVGAGGIGYFLQESMQVFDNRSVSTILIIIVLTVVVIDNVSAVIRHRID
ncbi:MULTISPECIES: phosphonate ABC transporter, permease protein PhnE [Paraburkholderia]|uniref:Phosphonate ABC transporter, permease protein PhnE n=1 Tax=Paraburkholderia podalyriae TaxID=1938811 RepID=A0ABR7PU48_9BURK|nr:phosphonate ABC transporter, permease protein PhnE [Paraburkholderia podalyriae]MBC8749778.1 phosphonate ABC transporter, permease protein PhnE [Paraburkholderia podalyriae]